MNHKKIFLTAFTIFALSNLWGMDNRPNPIMNYGEAVIKIPEGRVSILNLEVMGNHKTTKISENENMLTIISSDRSVEASIYVLTQKILFNRIYYFELRNFIDVSVNGTKRRFNVDGKYSSIRIFENNVYVVHPYIFGEYCTKLNINQEDDTIYLNTRISCNVM